MFLSDFVKHSEARLEALYPPQEARSIVSILCQEKLGVKSWTHITEPRTVIPDGALSREMEELACGKPLQYVLGYTEFCGRTFKVSPSVLIPRPETEELVALAKREGKKRILDLCTGSGCIAWSLSLDIPGAEVCAVDISEDALSVAASQFSQELVPPGHIAPEFVKCDILASCPESEPRYDLIVSNPPYIMDSERCSMRGNVLDWEPALALFVPDDDPLRFYKAIANWALALLLPGGTVIVEINECLGEQTAGEFKLRGFGDISIIKDVFGKNRFVRARKTALQDG